MRLSPGHLVLLATLFISSSALADDWPQWRGPQRDGRWTENGLIEAFASPQIEIKWRVPIGSGYSGPTVSEGRVFVMDRLVDPTQVERIHCIDEASGKLLWTHTYACVYTNS